MSSRCELPAAVIFKTPFWAAAVVTGFMLLAKPSAAAEMAAVRPIVALATIAARTDSLGEFIAAMQSDDLASERFHAAFGRNPEPPPMPHVVTVREYSSGSSTIRELMVAPNDPYFGRWESEARARLTAEDGESGAGHDKAHPLAIANPDKAVVICEAGCSPRAGSKQRFALIVRVRDPPLAGR